METWCLINQTDGIELQGLTLREVALIYRALPPTELSRWQVWRDGWDEWSRIEEVQEVLLAAEELYNQVSPVPPPLPPAPDQDLRVFRLEHTPRRSPRSQVRFAIEVICNGKEFRSHTRDVSLGGIRLEDQIPDWVAGYSSVVMMHPEGAKLEFLCTIVENQRADDKTRLEFRPSEAMTVLEDWLKKMSIRSA